MPLLTDSDLLKDPDFKKGKQLLLQAIEKHTKHITKIAPPQKQRASSYEQAIKEISRKRGAPLFFPYIGSGLGRGPFVQLADGSIKYDCISGIGAHFGHHHPAVTEAMIESSLSNTVMQGHLQQNHDSLTLMKKICKLAKSDHCFISTSGAMACENALKIALHYKQPAQRIFAFSNCFMGRTTTLSQISDRPNYRVGLLKNLQVTYLPFYEPGKKNVALHLLKEHLARYPGEYAACAMELVQGEGGFNVAPRSFFLPLLEELKAADIPILFDEVQTFGRTGEAFCFQTLGLEEFADIVMIGKLAQVCATIYRKKYQPQPGILSQTYTASTSSIRACSAILEEMQKKAFFGPKGKVCMAHRWFTSEFNRLKKEHHGLVDGPFGIGGMCSFTAFGGDAQKTKQLLHTLYTRGVICFTCGGDPLRIRFLFPLGAIEKEHIQEIAQIVSLSVQEIHSHG